MKRDSRLSSILHALLHMAEHDGPMTSEVLGRCLGTNPVVVRRTMGLLREALGEPAIFAIGNRNEVPECLVEQSVNAVLEGTFAEAEALLLERFADLTLADLAEDFSRRHAQRRATQA